MVLVDEYKLEVLGPDGKPVKGALGTTTIDTLLDFVRQDLQELPADGTSRVVITKRNGHLGVLARAR